MIEKFKENEARASGVVYKSTLDQIKKLYAADPELAGELAISAIELILTGEISSEDMMIGILLEPAKAVNENNRIKYDIKVENARMKKIMDMKLDKIAEMSKAGYIQREIGEKLGLSQQIVSYRMGLIKTSYPELLDAPAAQTEYKNTNDVEAEVFVNTAEEPVAKPQPKKPYFDF